MGLTVLMREVPFVDLAFACDKWAVANKTRAVACEAGRNLIEVPYFSVLASANEYLWHQFHS
jgi:hypothetical protein